MWAALQGAKTAKPSAQISIWSGGNILLTNTSKPSPRSSFCAREAAMSARRFPPLWSVEEQAAGLSCVQELSGD
jgi:hypothetical protein